MKLFFDTKNANATSSIKTANPNVITTSRRPSSVAANAPDPALLTPRNIFGRPMEPIPAPLVYINGGLGVGKEAVAESLASLLGQDKSLLVDVRAIGRDDDEDVLVKGDDDSTLSLMTPEHPGYFDYFAEEEQALASDNPNTSMTSASTKPSQPPQPPCSEKKLARLLSSPGNNTRIAIIAFCAFDTPKGHTALATFVTAATLANRLFIPVALSCEPTEKMRRALSSQRQYSSKNKNRLSMSFSMSTPGPISATSAAVASTSTSMSTLTLDISKSSAFETALQIMELVKRLVAERDTEAQSKRERFLLNSGHVGGFDGTGDDDGDYGREDDSVGELDYDGAGEGTSDSGSDGDADPDPDVYAENFSNLTTPMEGPGYEWKV
ncbi:hypothetical protein V8F33_000211 [Rhypophila sp. PSN 637]